MFVYLMRIVSPLRSNLLRFSQTQYNVRNYRIFKSLELNSRCVDNVKLSRIIAPTFKFIRNLSDQAFTDLNTNVANNVILWKYERPTYFSRMAVFSFVQFVILVGFSCVAFNYIPVWKDDMTGKDYTRQAYLPILLCVFSAIAGIATSWLLWFYTCRSLKYIILNRGGTTSTLVTYHPTKGFTSRVVPLEHIMTKRDRNDVGTFISMRIKGTRLFHLIDKEGTFVNPELYDKTVGLDRQPKMVRKKKDPDSLFDN